MCQLNVGENLPAGRMHQEERLFGTAWLDGHQGGRRTGRGLLPENFGEMLDRCSLKDGRQRKPFTEPLLDEGEQAYRQE